MNTMDWIILLDKEVNPIVVKDTNHRIICPKILSLKS